MIVTEQCLPEASFTILGQMLHKTWINMSGPSMPSSSFAWSEVTLRLSNLTISLRLEPHQLDIDGYIDEYPTLEITSDNQTPDNGRETEPFFHGQNEEVLEVKVIRDSITGFEAGTPYFHNVADIAIAIRLESHWIVICRASHFMGAFEINRVTQLSDASLPHTADEWESTLIHQYEFSREWIQVQPI